MAGSWYEIKHKKIRADKQRGATFTKLAQAITLSVKQGGGDPEMNPALDVVLRKAKAANMTNEIIDRAIKKGTGELQGDAEVKEVVYEGYGPHGIPMLVVAATDNTNRTVAHVRHVFSKHGGKYADSGSVSFQFARKGILMVQLPNADAELELIDAGVEDTTEVAPLLFQAICAPTELSNVMKALQQTEITIDEAKLGYIPLNPTVITSSEEMETIAAFLERMEDNDDIQEIYSTISMQS